MTTPTFLPTEILENIILFLDFDTLESVCRTFNHRLYSCAYRRWLPHLKAIGHARWCIDKFGSLDHGASEYTPPSKRALRHFYRSLSGYTETIPGRLLKTFGLDPNSGLYERSQQPRVHSWLQLDGSLDWMVPMDWGPSVQGDKFCNDRHLDRSIQPSERIDRLVHQAAQLKIALPPGFEKFMRSKISQHLFVPHLDGAFSLVPDIYACPADIDNNANGFLIRFFIDVVEDSFLLLYITPSGEHCVLGSAISDLTDNDYIDDYQRDSGGTWSEALEEPEQLPMVTEYLDKHDVMLEGFSFEEVLATLFFETLLDNVVQRTREDITLDVEVPWALKAYVAHTFRLRNSRATSIRFDSRYSDFCLRPNNLDLAASLQTDLW